MGHSRIGYEQREQVTLPDGRILSYNDQGPARGYPIFFLHGTPGSSVGLIPRPFALSLRKIRLITPDRPGYGGSDRHEGRTIASVAADLGSLATQLGIENFSVIGKSGGAPHALACAALLPKRVRTAAALVSLAPRDAEGLDWYDGMGAGNTAVYRDMDTQRTADRGSVSWGIAYKRTMRGLRGTVEAIRAGSFINEGLWADAPKADRLILSESRIRKLLQEAFDGAVCSPDNISEGRSVGQMDDHQAFMKPWGFDPYDIVCPTLLWHGMEDVYSPSGHSTWLADRMGRTAIADISLNGGHFGAVEEFPHALTWLARTALYETGRLPDGRWAWADARSAGPGGVGGVQ